MQTSHQLPSHPEGTQESILAMTTNNSSDDQNFNVKLIFTKIKTVYFYKLYALKV